MSKLRRAILALALIAGITPAMAAPPPPVPSVLDNERRTQYTISGTTCACAVNFSVFGDSSDFQNWIEVWLNGVRVNYNDSTAGWTLTSPTGPIGLIPRPITDALVTFNSAQTGTVQIVGARRPRRISQFNTRSAAPRDLDVAFSDLVTMMRETWDRTNDVTGRALMSQPGVTMGNLPLPLTCQSAFLGFDALGYNPVCRSSSGTGNVTLPVVDNHVTVFDGIHGLLKDGGPYVPQINTRTPEEFYLAADGANWTPTFERAITAMAALPAGGNLRLACGTTYTFSTASSNAYSVVRLLSSVNIIGCGHSSVIKIANGVNTSSAFFIGGLANLGTLNHVRLADFTLDMNGANNSCGGTCWHLNAGIYAAAGGNLVIENVRIINNPGSNDISIGTDSSPPAFTNLLIKNTLHDNSGDRVNAASADFSAIFVIASNSLITGQRYSQGPTVNGSAFEIHGEGTVVTDQVVKDYFNCGIIANLSTLSNLTKNIGLHGFKCYNVKAGLQLYSFSGGTLSDINISDGIIDYRSGFQGMGIDACSQMDVASISNTNLSIDNVQIKSSVIGSSLGNDASGICVSRFLTAKVNNNQLYNIQGAGIEFQAQVAGAGLAAFGNQITNPGQGGNTALQAGIVVKSTAVTTDNISIQNNAVNKIGAATAPRYGVINSQNSTGGFIIGNSAPDVSVGQLSNTGTGVFAYTLPGASMTFAGTDTPQTFTANQRFNDTFLLLNGSTSGTLNLRAPAIAASSVIRFPAGTTDFSATGGTSQVVKQVTSGAPFTVGRLQCSDLSDAAAGCTGGGAAGAALTKTDDTNVTLTLTGSPTTSLLAATNIAVGWTSTLANSRLATMATNTVKGNATSGTASPTDLAVGTCSTTGSALIWTTNTGFGCNTSIVASSATNATNVGITDDTTTNATMYPTWVTANTGNLPEKVSSTKFTFNPSTGTVAATNFSATTNVGANTFNNVVLTTPASTATFTLGSGKTIGISNSLTFTGTDGSSVAFGAGGTVIYNGGALGTPSSGIGTNITGVNAASLGGATFAAPGTIGGGTPAAITGTTITGTTSVTTTPTTVGSLPSCAGGTKGARSFVTDSNAVSYTAGIGAVVAAGGTTNVPVVCDGTNWRIG